VENNLQVKKGGNMIDVLAMFKCRPRWFDFETKYSVVQSTNTIDPTKKELVLENNLFQNLSILHIINVDNQTFSFEIAINKHCQISFESQKFREFLGLKDVISNSSGFMEKMKTLRQKQESPNIICKRKGRHLTIECREKCSERIAPCQRSIYLTDEILKSLKMLDEIN
jgi:hypothetical protein